MVKISDQELELIKLRLKESEDKYYQIFQASPYAITITRAADGRFIDVNAAFISISGFTRAEALSSSSIALKLWADEKDRQRVVNDLGAGRIVKDQEYLFRRKSGTAFTGLFFAQIIKLAQETCVLSLIIDITDRKRAEKQMQRKDRVFDLSIAANSIADMGGNIIEVNRSFLLLWGLSSRDEVTGKPIAQYFNDQNEALNVISALNSTGQWAGEFTAKRKDGSTFIADGLATTLTDEHGKVDGYQSTVIDITERKRAEEELVNKVKELEKTTKIMEGREDKIIELKQRVKELEGKLK